MRPGQITLIRTRPRFIVTGRRVIEQPLDAITLPLFISTETSPLLLPTTTSLCPSPFTSPIATDVGWKPPLTKGEPDTGRSAPPLVPSSTEMSPLLLAIATSSRRSPFTSPAVIATGWNPPVGKGDAAAGVIAPTPLPSNRDESPVRRFEVATSALPSPLKSPAPPAFGKLPPLSVGIPGARARPPCPSPSRIDTSPLLPLATATSALPSRL